MDKEGFTREVIKAEKTLYRTAKAILSDDEDVKDAVQNALMKAFDKYRSVRNDKYFKTWLIRILINECYMLIDTVADMNMKEEKKSYLKKAVWITLAEATEKKRAIVEKMNAEMAEGTSTVKYAGNLRPIQIAAGGERLYIAGKGRIDTMKLMDDTSEEFYTWSVEDEDEEVASMAEGYDGSLYVTVIKRERIFNPAGGYRLKGSRLLHLSNAGILIKSFDFGAELMGSIALDEKGNVYIKNLAFGESGFKVYRFDKDLEKTGEISGDFGSMALCGMCIGRDGELYVLSNGSMDKSISDNAIYRADFDENKMELAGNDILPKKVPYFDLLRPGKDNDFVIWGDDGVYTYDLNDEKAVCVKPGYELPVDAECHATLYGDEYLVFMKSYSGDEDGPYAEDTYFYYVRI